MNFILLIGGFFLLVQGANFFVSGSSSIAKKLKISSLIIGLTLVSLGTSAPEAAVSITASLKGANQMALANVVGSNIFNLLVVLGACAVITPYAIKRKIVLKDYPFMVFATLILLILVFGRYNQETSIFTLSTSDGLVLLMCLGLYIYSTVLGVDKNEYEDDDSIKLLSTKKSIFYTILGIIMILIGGNLTVSSATSIATNFGISQNVIGLTIVAMGTSLPELVTSIVALRKGQVDMAVGNVVGSCIFNVLFVLGSSVALSDLTVELTGFNDLIYMTAVTILCYFVIFTGKKVSRIEGIILLIIYASYIAYAIVR